MMLQRKTESWALPCSARHSLGSGGAAQRPGHAAAAAHAAAASAKAELRLCAHGAAQKRPHKHQQARSAPAARRRGHHHGARLAPCRWSSPFLFLVSRAGLAAPPRKKKEKKRGMGIARPMQLAAGAQKPPPSDGDASGGSPGPGQMTSRPGAAPPAGWRSAPPAIADIRLRVQQLSLPNPEIGASCNNTATLFSTWSSWSAPARRP
jgi:hypothetical protein